MNLRLRVTEVNRTSSQELRISGIDLYTNNGSGDDEQTNVLQVLLQGVWTQNRIIKHSILHILNPDFDDATKLYTVNNSKGFLVLEPDNLLTCTYVASSLFCERKTWLNHVFLGQVGTNRAMLVGTLVHEVFQYGVKNKIADVDKLVNYLDELLNDATVMLEIYSVEMKLKDIRDEAMSYVPSVKEWIEKFMFSGPCYPLTNDSSLEVKVVGIQDIEENVWSTKYGLKGKIDVTGTVKVHDRRAKSTSDKIIPLELKTGNPNLSSSHAAQVSLYSMMIEDRYAETNQGFVIYLKDKAAMHNVALTHNIKRDLIQRRNQINYHMKSYYYGPEMLDQPRVCKNCERLTECMLMADIYTPGKVNEYSSMKSLEAEAASHLDEKFKSFFQKHHEKLVRLLMSKQDSSNGAKNSVSKSSDLFWTYSSEEAEARGLGFGKLQVSLVGNKADSRLIKLTRHLAHDKSFIEPLANQESDENGHSQPVIKKQKISDFFEPAKKAPGKKRLRPFDTTLNFSRCRMALSLDLDETDMDSQNSSTAIAIGFINEVKDDQLIMKLYEGALDVIVKPDLMYRIDKLQKGHLIDIERTVLVRLLTREDWRCDRIRQLILDPKFKPQENKELNLFVLATGFEEIKELDARQQKFVVEAVSTDNYFILDEKIEPDAGKVHKTISVLARVVLNLNRTLLIVAQNIDNLVDLMRLLQHHKLRFILLDDGKSTKARFQFASNLVKVSQSQNLDIGKKFEVYIRQMESSPIVITSYAMSIGGLLFTRRTFDYCIAYDCDSTELLVSLSPMFCSDRYIIIDVENEKNIAFVNDRKCAEDISFGNHLRALRKGAEK